jgi:hypothetical protein
VYLGPFGRVALARPRKDGAAGPARGRAAWGRAFEAGHGVQELYAHSLMPCLLELFGPGQREPLIDPVNAQGIKADPTCGPRNVHRRVPGPKHQYFGTGRPPTMLGCGQPKRRQEVGHVSARQSVARSSQERGRVGNTVEIGTGNRQPQRHRRPMRQDDAVMFARLADRDRRGRSPRRSASQRPPRRADTRISDARIITVQLVVVGLGTAASLWATWRITNRELVPVSRSAVGVRIAGVSLVLACGVVAAWLYVLINAADWRESADPGLEHRA